MWPAILAGAGLVSGIVGANEQRAESRRRDALNGQLDVLDNAYSGLVKGKSKGVAPTDPGSTFGSALGGLTQGAGLGQAIEGAGTQGKLNDARLNNLNLQNQALQNKMPNPYVANTGYVPPSMNYGSGGQGGYSFGSSVNGYSPLRG